MKRIIGILPLLLAISAFTLPVNAAIQQPSYQHNDSIPAEATGISPLLYGEKMPAATLKDKEGRSVNLGKLVAERPTVLVFFRGGWCPYCSKQLSGLQELTGELQQMGYQLIAISTDKPEGLKEVALQKKLEYTLLSDADLALSKKVGIAFKAPEPYWKFLPATTGGKDTDLLLPVPAVFILDRKGGIQFEYINPDFMQRLQPALLQAAAKALINEL